MRLLLLIVLSLACLQCQENCEPPFDKTVLVKFLDYNTKKDLADSLVFRIVFGEGSQYVVDTTVLAKNILKLPVNPQADSVVFQFILKKPIKTYKATIHYRRTPEIRNPDCGISMQYDDLRVGSRQQIDSIAIGNTTLYENTTSQPNMVFYIKP